jgi:hypothetical protein
MPAGRTFKFQEEAASPTERPLFKDTQNLWYVYKFSNHLFSFLELDPISESRPDPIKT